MSRCLLIATAVTLVAVAPVEAQWRLDTSADTVKRTHSVPITVLWTSLGSAGGLYLGALGGYMISSGTPGAVRGAFAGSAFTATLMSTAFTKNFRGSLIGSVLGSTAGYALVQRVEAPGNDSAVMLAYLLTHGLTTTAVAGLP